MFEVIIRPFSTCEGVNGRNRPDLAPICPLATQPNQAGRSAGPCQPQQDLATSVRFGHRRGWEINYFRYNQSGPSL